MMLASGYSPVYAAHMPARRSTARRASAPAPSSSRSGGTASSSSYVKNPDYFVKGRPYLDGLKYIVIKERGTRTAALQAGQLDVAMPGETTKAAAEQLKAAVPKLVVTPSATNVTDNIIMNVKKPPFDNQKVRLAVSLRHRPPRPGPGRPPGRRHAGRRAWLPEAARRLGRCSRRTSSRCPATARPADMKAQARKLLAEANITPQNPLKVEIATRAIAVYVDMASFVINELKQVGIEASLKQIDTAQWHAMATRGDYQIGANLTGLGPDDPDANFYENYACGSPRNYSVYCNEQVMKMIDAQSAELDPKKRLAQVQAIQKKLEDDAARPILGWRLDYFTIWPHVKNLVPHQSIYNFGRMQEVWRDS